MPWFEMDAGYRLWYEEQGEGPPIVFIHGWCMSSAVWGLQRAGLSESFRVVTLDLRGHGNSPQHPEGFNITGCATDIAALIEYLGIFDAILVGWSLGVLIAIEISLINTERITGLALISGTPLFVQSPDFKYGLSQAEVDGMTKKVFRNISRALEGFIARMFASGERDFATIKSLLSAIPLPTTDVALQALEALVSTDMRDRLSMITCPTLIVCGDCDVICLPEASQFMARQIPLSSEVVFSSCGHVPFLTQSKLFNDCLVEFRRRVSRGVEY